MVFLPSSDQPPQTSLGMLGGQLGYRFGNPLWFRVWCPIAILAILASLSAASASAIDEDSATSSTILQPTVAIGDTLTVIQRPLLNLPALITPGDTLKISCVADPATTGWTAALLHDSLVIPLEIVSSNYDPTTLWWTLSALIPSLPLFELFDLRVDADGGLTDTTQHAVRVIDHFKSDFYFMHITDTHLPDHDYHDQGGSVTDSTEIVDLREVILDINLINPEFVLLTGDVVNEGELEDYLDWRSYTRAQQLLTECEVPIFLIAGNHDIGGWDSTPPSDGTARRNWWRFFGWPHLNNPPPGAPEFTQNYSFDYGSLHFTALESYINYDNWRSWIYGGESFTAGQLAWLNADLDRAASSAVRILFYHYDFSSQLDLSDLGVDMALWGHIHSDSGNITNYPFDISTDNVCGGDRSYRLIRVSGSTLHPRPTLTAGSSGDILRIEFAGANDGTQDLQEAILTNNHSESFEHGLVKFLMPTDGTYHANTGTILQVDQSGEVAVVYLGVDIQPHTTLPLTVWLEPTSLVQSDTPTEPTLEPNYPNPFNPLTVLTFTLPQPSHVKLTIYDLLGREVAVVVNGQRPAGRHEAQWDGRDRLGRFLPSGVYVVHLVTGGKKFARKIVLMR